jgi:2'-5' RNA ligase
LGQPKVSTKYRGTLRCYKEVFRTPAARSGSPGPPLRPFGQNAWVRAGRVQATIFLPAEVAAPIDEWRRKWDPTTARRIAPHVTVLHHVVPGRELDVRLEQLARVLPRFRLRLGRVCRWPAPDAGLYVEVDDPDRGLSRLRNLLAGVAAGGNGHGYTPHVTLAHRRTVERETLERAWEALRGNSIDQVVDVGTVAVVESTAAQWVTAGEFALQPV